MKRFRIKYKFKDTEILKEAFSRSSISAKNRALNKIHETEFTCDNISEAKHFWNEKNIDGDLEFYSITDLSIVDGVNTWYEFLEKGIF